MTQQRISSRGTTSTGGRRVKGGGRLHHAPPATSNTVRKLMQANRSVDTRPEIKLRKALWQAGLRGYRVAPHGIPGSPDIVFLRQKVAVFVHGCFWHRCPHCKLPLPRTNADFWQAKFQRNVDRDVRTQNTLQSAGWQTIVVWECALQRDVQRVVAEVACVIGSKPFSPTTPCR